jgi:hypothetical protein
MPGCAAPSHIASTLFDVGAGDLVPELDDRLEPLGSRIVILDSARLGLEWRGFGLGALLAGTAIMKLSGGARFAACYPAPLRPDRCQPARSSGRAARQREDERRIM